MESQTHWESLGLPAVGNAFTGVVPKGGSRSQTVDKKEAQAQRKRDYEREYYHRRRKAALKAKALRVNPTAQ